MVLICFVLNFIILRLSLNVALRWLALLFHIWDIQIQLLAWMPTILAEAFHDFPILPSIFWISTSK